jgi:hypothetical protein
VGVCNSGFANCNGVAADGCEVNTTNTASSCGACGTNCAAICSTNVAAVACVASSCQVTACTGGRYNVDGICSTGCECATTGATGVCGSPTALGVLSPGQVTSFTGNLVPAGQEAWLSVTFVGEFNTSYHPHVRFSSGSSEFRFDILSNCSGGALSCATEGGSSVNRTDWEVFYTGGDPTSYPEAGSHFNPIPAVGSGGTVLIHVYRRAGAPVTCNNYTLQILN